MIESKCVYCGKTIQWDGYSPVQYVCEECLSPFLKKNRPGKFITNFKEIKVGADENADGRQRVP